MVGLITKKEVMRRPFLILRLYGWRVFLAVLRAGEKDTFLSIVANVHMKG